MAAMPFAGPSAMPGALRKSIVAVAAPAGASSVTMAVPRWKGAVQAGIIVVRTLETSTP